MHRQEFLDALASALSELSPQEKEEQLGFYGEMIADRMEEGLTEEEAVAATGDPNELALAIKEQINARIKEQEEARREAEQDAMREAEESVTDAELSAAQEQEAEIPQERSQNPSQNPPQNPPQEEPISKPTRREKWKTVLLCVGFPVWLPLAIAAGAVLFLVGIALLAAILSLTVSALAVIVALTISLWSVIVCLWAGFVGLTIGSVGTVFVGVCNTFGGERIFGMFIIGMGLFCAGLSVFWWYGCIAATKGSTWLTKRTYVLVGRILKAMGMAFRGNLKLKKRSKEQQ